MARRYRLILALLLGLALAGAPASGTSALEGAPWRWPIAGPVLRPFDPPEDPYGAGHRGIDIVAPIGTSIAAPADGIVSFAGKVGGQFFVTIDHGNGLTSTCSWVSGFSVSKGDLVAKGSTIATSGAGHAGLLPAHLHFGIRLDGAYVDPLEFLGPPPVAELIHLAPLQPSAMP